MTDRDDAVMAFINNLGLIFGIIGAIGTGLNVVSRPYQMDRAVQKYEKRKERKQQEGGKTNGE